MKGETIMTDCPKCGSPALKLQRVVMSVSEYVCDACCKVVYVAANGKIIAAKHNDVSGVEMTDP